MEKRCEMLLWVKLDEKFRPFEDTRSRFEPEHNFSILYVVTLYDAIMYAQVFIDSAIIITPAAGAYLKVKPSFCFSLDH